MILLQNPKKLPSLYQPYAFLTLLMGERIPLMTSTIPSYISVVLFFGQKGDKKKKGSYRKLWETYPSTFSFSMQDNKKNTHADRFKSFSSERIWEEGGKKGGEGK